MNRNAPLLGLLASFWLASALLVDPAGDVMSDALLAPAVSLVERGQLSIPVSAALDLVTVGGKHYSGLGPGGTFLAAPFYLVLRPLIAALPDAWALRRLSVYSLEPPTYDTHVTPKEVYFLQILLVWLLVAPLKTVLLYQLLRLAERAGCSAAGSLRLAAACGFGTLIFPYSCVYSKQFLAHALIWTSLLRHADVRRPASPARFLATGLLFGVAVGVDYAAAVSAALCGAFLWRRARGSERAAFSAGLAAALGLTCAYHDGLYGRPFATPYSLRDYGGISVDYKGRTYDIVELFGGEWLSFGRPTAASLWGLTFSPFRGLFFYCPVLLAGAWGLVRALGDRRRRAVALLCLSVSASYLVLNASMPAELYWSGVPWFFGPRYLIAAVPFLAVGLLQLPRGRATTRLVDALVGVSALNNLLGAMFQDTFITAKLDDPRLQSPILHGLRELASRGPRVPLLDVYGVGRGAQWGAAGLLVAACAAAAAVWVGVRPSAAPAARRAPASAARP